MLVCLFRILGDILMVLPTHWLHVKLHSLLLQRHSRLLVELAIMNAKKLLKV